MSFHTYVRRWSPTGKTLDVGCGLHRASKWGLDVRPTSHVVGSAYALPVRSKTLDGVVCAQVVGYYPDPCAMLVEIHRVLRPEGVLLLTDARFGSGRWWKRWGHILRRLGFDVARLPNHRNYRAWWARKRSS